MITDNYSAQEIARGLVLEAAKDVQLLDFSSIRRGLVKEGVDPALYKGLEKTCFALFVAEGVLEDTGEKVEVGGRSFNLYKSLIF